MSPKGEAYGGVGWVRGRTSLLVWSFCFYFSAPTKQFLMNKPQNYPNVWLSSKNFRSSSTRYIYYIKSSAKGQVLSAQWRQPVGGFVCAENLTLHRSTERTKRFCLTNMENLSHILSPNKISPMYVLHFLMGLKNLVRQTCRSSVLRLCVLSQLLLLSFIYFQLPPLTSHMCRILIRNLIGFERKWIFNI